MIPVTTLLRKLPLNRFVNAPTGLFKVRNLTKFVDKPLPGVNNKCYRRTVHYPEEYTVKPLEVTNLGGRDPVTGRLVCKGIGGGIKHKYHWIEWKRQAPENGPPKVEKVIKIMKDGCRTAHIALVAHEDKLKYYLATENMKAGDLIKTFSEIPRIPVRPQEGDAHPLGALPIGSQINCVELIPGMGGLLVHSAGSFATIIRKAANNHVVIQTPSKREFCLPETCMCTVGRLSNLSHSSTPVGSAQKNRELGNRPRSGWWQRKSGKHGRKIKRPPPMRICTARDKNPDITIKLTLPGLP